MCVRVYVLYVENRVWQATFLSSNTFCHAGHCLSVALPLRWRQYPSEFLPSNVAGCVWKTQACIKGPPHTAGASSIPMTWPKRSDASTKSSLTQYCKTFPPAYRKDNRYRVFSSTAQGTYNIRIFRCVSGTVRGLTIWWWWWWCKHTIRLSDSRGLVSSTHTLF